MTDLKKLFSRNLEQALKSASWLDRSVKLVKKKSLSVPIEPETADVYEMLSSRFSRATDILTTRLWRSLDALELEEPGTLIDVIQRAHKRGIITDPNSIRQARELRNQIAHEYEDEKLVLIWTDILRLSPDICNAIKATDKYSQEKGY